MYTAIRANIIKMALVNNPGVPVASIPFSSK
jgi:hypothetical protein